MLSQPVHVFAVDGLDAFTADFMMEVNIRSGSDDKWPYADIQQHKRTWYPLWSSEYYLMLYGNLSGDKERNHRQKAE